MSPFRMHRRRAIVAIALACLATACTPTFNWREVPVGDGDLTVLLPCKPDRAERMLPLGAESVRIDMAGCEAGGVTFAVAHAEASGPAQASAWLDAWRQSTRGRLADRAATESVASLPRAAAAGSGGWGGRRPVPSHAGPVVRAPARARRVALPGHGRRTPLVARGAGHVLRRPAPAVRDVPRCAGPVRQARIIDLPPIRPA
jgi:hypothetical protein